MPEVSVILPTHRDDGYLDSAIQSILNQQSIQLELIIIANNCPDSLWEKIKQIKDPRVRPFRTKIPQLAFNLNYALDVALSEFVARMDGDDLSSPQRLKVQFDFLKNNPDVDVVGSNVTIINEKNEIIGPRIFPNTHTQIIKKMQISNCICHPSVMFRKSKILALGGYLGGFQSEDYDLWLRGIGLKSLRFANIQEPLLSYRLHSNSTQGNPRSYFEVVGHFARLFLQFRSTYFFIGLLFALLKGTQKLR